MSTRLRNIRPCAVANCDQITGVPGSAKGLCGLHYQRMKKHGHTEPTRARNICAVSGCDAWVVSRGWCSKHHTRWRRYGSPTYRMPGEIVCGRRICPRCRLDLPVGNFGSDKNYRSGLRPCCKQCDAARVRCWRQRTGYKSPQPPPHIVRMKSRAWRKRNPDRVRSSTAARRARKRNALVERFSPQEIFERDNWVCHICRGAIDPALPYPEPLSASLDHVIPYAAGIARGGVHSRANCAASHLVCNLRKQAKILEV